MRNPIAWAVLGILAVGAGSALIVYLVTQPPVPTVASYTHPVTTPYEPYAPPLPASALPPAAAPPPVSAYPAPIIVPAGPAPTPGAPSPPPAVIQGPSAIPLSEDEEERTAQVLEVRRQRMVTSMDELNRRAAARLQRQPAAPPAPVRR
jgi:hypothetical protein